MDDVMIDIETYSVRPNASILTLGAIKFDRNSSLPKLEKMDTFYRKITLKSNIDKNRDIDPKTQEWWSEQPEEAQREMTDPKDRISLKKALTEFSQWFGDSKYIWSHGDDFDTVIVNDAMKECGMETPWKFYNTRDTRTLFDLAGVYNSDLPQNTKHHAVHDCYRQIAGVFKSLRKLNL